MYRVIGRPVAISASHYMESAFGEYRVIGEWTILLYAQHISGKYSENEKNEYEKLLKNPLFSFALTL